VYDLAPGSLAGERTATAPLSAATAPKPARTPAAGPATARR